MSKRKRPMLALSMGLSDLQKGQRMKFLESCIPILNRLGWCIGVELKGGQEMGGDIQDYCDRIVELGGRITWHWPNTVGKLLNKGISDEHLLITGITVGLKSHGLEAVTMHCAPAVSIDPAENTGIERYCSPISAKEMLEHLEAQVEPLRKLNQLVGGILQIENVDITNFRDGGTKVPTYLALQTGTWHDLFWLAKQADLRMTFDSEHYFCALNFLTRRKDFAPFDQRRYDPIHDPSLPADELNNIINLSERAGYFLMKYLMPYYNGGTSLKGFIMGANPKLFHLGGAVQSVDDRGRLATHLPNFEDHEAKEALDLALTRTMENPDVIGCVIEVCGQLQPERYSRWSPRPQDDEIAKMQTYLYVINRIEELQKKGM